MNEGNWVPLDKKLIHYLPKDRAYTILEAMFSYSVDVNNDKKISVNGYARMWSWSRNKVRRFVHDMENHEVYIPENDAISKDRGRTGKGQAIRFVNSYIQPTKDRGRTGKGQHL